MTLFVRMFLSCIAELLLCAFLCFYPFIRHLRFSRRKTCAITCGLVVSLGLAFAGICCYLNLAIPPAKIFPKADIAFLVCLVPCGIWYLYAIEEIWQKKLYIFALMLTVGLAAAFVMNVAGALLIPGGGAAPNPFPNLPQLAAVTAALVPLLWLLLKFFYLPVCDGLSRRDSSYLAVLSILLFATLAGCLIPVNYMPKAQPQSLLLCAILLLAVFAIYLVCFQMFHYAHKSMAAQQVVADMRHRFAINNEQYKRIRDTIETSRRLRHDFHHHIAVVQGFLAAGELQKAQSYLAQFAAEQKECVVGAVCENPVVDMVVGYYRAMAYEKEIAFTTNIVLPQGLAVQDSDLSVLLGNLLENAISAAECARPEYRYIVLNMLCSGKMLAITVDNGFSGAVRPERGGYCSTKENHTGIGLQSIRDLAERYGGGTEFIHETYVFHASVMLNVG